VKRFGQGRDLAIGAVIIICLVMVVAWETMAVFNVWCAPRYSINAADMAGFVPDSDNWTTRRIAVNADPESGDNIFAMEVCRKAASNVVSRPVVVRLAHGYNVPECMKLKGCQVVSDGRISVEVAGQGAALESWQMVSANGDRTAWCAVVLRASDFREAGVEVASLAFPRMSRGDDPAWQPGGISWRSLRHPLLNAQKLIIRKWSNARCDLLTFLRLRRPSTPSDTLLTLVGYAAQEGHGHPYARDTVADALSHVWSQLRLEYGKE
jgi:hypothetical protein